MPQLEQAVSVNNIMTETTTWKFQASLWALIAISAAVLIIPFYDGLDRVVRSWFDKEEYSHGILIPFVAAFLVWQKKDQLAQIDFRGAWSGLALVVIGGSLFLLGELSTIYTVVQYAFLVTLVGLFIAVMGWQGFKTIWLALALLIFMIPLPNFLYNNLSSQLQLISSEIGVWFIRLFDISVYLEGNVIDLGSMKLQVVEACDGLRYLFPLMTLGVIIAIFYRVHLWKRWFVFLSSIPITVLMNSFRIGAIGLTVEYWGKEMAQGFLHDFEGWAVFMASFAVMLLEIVLLTRLTGDRRPFREVFALELPAPTNPDADVHTRILPKPFYAAIAILGLLVIVSLSLGERKEIQVNRETFDRFPSQVGEWRGDPEQMEQQYVRALAFDDYLLADYMNATGLPLNLYIAYYDSQRKGASVHSPRSCLPGGGWRIKRLTQERLAGVTVSETPLTVNRVLMTKGDQQALVYYWLQQRGRVITNEYMAKWWIFWDALTRNRTDGALVRLTVPIAASRTVDLADTQLKDFTAAISKDLPRFIPD